MSALSCAGKIVHVVRGRPSEVSWLPECIGFTGEFICKKSKAFCHVCCLYKCLTVPFQTRISEDYWGFKKKEIEGNFRPGNLPRLWKKNDLPTFHILHFPVFVFHSGLYIKWNSFIHLSMYSLALVTEFVEHSGPNDFFS